MPTLELFAMFSRSFHFFEEVNCNLDGARQKIKNRKQRTENKEQKNRAERAVP